MSFRVYHRYYSITLLQHLFMRDPKIWLLTLSLITLTVAVKANNGGKEEKAKSEPTIQGMVSDGLTNRPVRGVTISIRYGNIPMQVTTDASGNFTIPGMPQGQVTMILEKKGYKTYRKDGLRLKQGMVIIISPETEEPEVEEGDVFHPLRRMIDGFK